MEIDIFHLNGVLKGVISDKGRMSLIGPGKLVSIDLSDVLQAAPDSYVEKLRNVVNDMKLRKNVRLHFIGHTDADKLSPYFSQASPTNSPGVSREPSAVVSKSIVTF